MLRLPLIDIGDFCGGTPAQQRAIAAAVDAAARTVGFMQIVGHAVPESATIHLAAAIDGFFGLPDASKQACRAARADINRGYTGLKSERLSYSLGVMSPADLFEAYNVGTPASAFPQIALPIAHYPENIWPSQPPLFRAQVESWFLQAGILARRLTRIFACALQLPLDYFVPFETHSVDTLRLNHYRLPDGDDAVEPGQMGMGGHTDYGIVTVLWADAACPGLQILDGGGVWHDVLPQPGALLVNLGDMLARWTNERWISTLHRVLPPRDAQGRTRRRRSAAFFHDGNHDAVIACLPGCCDATHPALYPPVTVGEHLDAKLRGSRGLTLNPAAEREAARLHGGSPQ